MLFLILSVLEDDQRKLVEDIFKNNYKKYLRIATRILSSSTVAEEAVSDALIKISQNIKRISHLPCPEMEAFCVTIVKNCAYDHLRKNSRIVTDSDNNQYQDAPSYHTPEAEMINKEETLAIRRLLDKLPYEDKQFLEMRYTYEMKYSEIASHMSISEEAAKKRGQRILSKLKKIYEKESSNYVF